MDVNIHSQAIAIIDNFLSEEEFLKLSSIIMSENFPWYYFPYKVNNKSLNSLQDFQFCHVVYHDNMVKSNFIEHFNPLLIKMKVGHLVRLKVNLTPRSDEIFQYDPHIDVSHFNFQFGKIGIFYINTNDGFTILENGDKIESIENRLLLLDPKIMHSGTSCTDQKIRCVINVNFFPYV